MKQVIAKFQVTIDLSESVQEMIEDGELKLNNQDIREFALECVMEDLQDISHSLSDVKFHTYIEIEEVDEL